MIRKIVTDVMFLKGKSTDASKEDLFIAKDLQDTLAANKDRCVGMAANMIGYKKKMIIVSFGFMDMVMINPKILKKEGEFETEEGCLSLQGVRKTKRYKKIKLQYQDTLFKIHTQEYSGYIAQIIQHECDHLEGIII